MANITTCTKCGGAYEASSEEQANEPDERLCFACRGVGSNDTCQKHGALVCEECAREEGWREGIDAAVGVLVKAGGASPSAALDAMAERIRALKETPLDAARLRPEVEAIAKEMDECPVSHAYAGAQDAIVTDWAKRLRRALASGTDHSAATKEG